MQVEIEVEFDDDTIKLKKVADEIRNDANRDLVGAQAIRVLDETYQHMRACLVATLSNSAAIKTDVVVMVPARQLPAVNDALRGGS